MKRDLIYNAILNNSRYTSTTKSPMTLLADFILDSNFSKSELENIEAVKIKEFVDVSCDAVNNNIDLVNVDLIEKEVMAEFGVTKEQLYLKGKGKFAIYKYIVWHLSTIFMGRIINQVDLSNRYKMNNRSSVACGLRKIKDIMSIDKHMEYRIKKIKANLIYSGKTRFSSMSEIPKQ